MSSDEESELNYVRRVEKEELEKARQKRNGQKRHNRNRQIFI